MTFSSIQISLYKQEIKKKVLQLSSIIYLYNLYCIERYFKWMKISEPAMVKTSFKVFLRENLSFVLPNFNIKLWTSSHFEPRLEACPVPVAHNYCGYWEHLMRLEDHWEHCVQQKWSHSSTNAHNWHSCMTRCHGFAFFWFSVSIPLSLFPFPSHYVELRGAQ